MFLSDPLPAALPSAYGSRHLALGQSGSADPASQFSLFINPAIPLTDSSTWNFDIALLNLYQIPGLYQTTGQIRSDHYHLPILIGWNSYGNALYQEHHFRGGLGFNAGSQIRIAFSADYFLQDIARYGQASAFSLGCSGFWKNHTNLSAGFSLDHLIHSKWSNRSGTVPVFVSAGLQYRLKEFALINFDLAREDSQPFEYRFGGIISLLPGFEILLGLRSPVEVFSAGFMFTKNDYNLGYGFAWHPILGFSHAASFHLAI